jgi:hypothetical protein
LAACGGAMGAAIGEDGRFHGRQAPTMRGADTPFKVRGTHPGCFV